MATSLILTFANPINKSLQKGDTVYHALITNNVTGTPVEIGTVTSIASEDDGLGSTINQVTCSIDSSASIPTTDSFYFFSKDNKANLSSLVGYYAEVEMKNESTSEAELYQVGSDISESSKS
tara:strand:+ start:646 stop:1011 length:366 start_codon:yes stop_codon:yes gene_type:complete